MFDDQYRLRLLPGGISTDDIIPARYKHMHTDPSQLAPHVFENRFPGLAATFRDGDAIACAGLFGIGSSREQAVSSLQAAGVRLVIAPSFGRIFFRNAWNLGLLAIEAPTTSFEEGQMIGIDPLKGTFQSDRPTPNFKPPPQLMIDMVRAGGLMRFVLSERQDQTIG
jgi:3-isopropylmalate/(R)-2-methylmalate dehydratase small subunit